MDARKPGFVLPEIDQAIADAYLELQARLPAADLYTSSGLTISAAADTFTLPATVSQYTGNSAAAEYAGDVRIRLRSIGRFLQKCAVEEIDSWRTRAPTSPQGIPEKFALWEDKSQIVQGRVWPAALAAEVCDIFVRLSADDVRDFIGAGTDDMDDVSILFSRIAAQALALYVSADLIGRMTPEDLKERRLNPAIAAKWLHDAEVMLYQEAARRHDLAGVGRTQRWVN